MRDHPDNPGSALRQASGLRRVEPVVELNEAGSSSPQCVLRVRAVAFVISSPFAITERARDIGEVPTRCRTFGLDLLSQRAGVGRFGKLDALTRPSAQRLDDLFVASVVASPEARGAIDLVVPDRPLRWPPPPHNWKLVEPNELGKCFEMRRMAQPGHTVGRLVDDQSDRDALEFVVAIEEGAVHVAGNDAHVGPLLDAVEFIGDVTQSADSRRSLHALIVAQPKFDWRGAHIPGNLLGCR